MKAASQCHQHLFGKPRLGRQHCSFLLPLLPVLGFPLNKTCYVTKVRSNDLQISNSYYRSAPAVGIVLGNEPGLVAERWVGLVCIANQVPSHENVDG